MRSPKQILVVALALLMVTSGCALMNLVFPRPTPTPTAVVLHRLRPTFTPTPIPAAATASGQASEAGNQTPGQAQPPVLLSPEQPQPQAATAPPTELPTPTPQPPTPIPTPTRTPTPTSTPTPFALVALNGARARSGPGLNYDKLGVLSEGQELDILGRTETGDWWELCCLDDQVIWVYADLITVRGSAANIPVAIEIPPSPTPTATPTPVPYIVVKNPRVNVRTGPGTDFEIIGQAERGQRLEIIGRNYDSSWWQVCCIEGQQGWIIGRLVRIEGPAEAVALAAGLPTPTPTPTPTAVVLEPTPTPTAIAVFFMLAETTTYPFDGHDYFRVGAKVSDESGNPLGGYYLHVRNETTGQEWLSGISNGTAWTYSSPNPNAADFRQINVEFDTRGRSSAAGNSFAVWLVNGSGQQVSPVVRFAVEEGEFQWLYVVFQRR